MAVTQLEPVLRHIRHLAGSANISGSTDGQLLEKYLLDSDEEAFAVLVRRHGAMVLGVCRRVLHDVQDAEDAFQATFLVLIRSAARILNRESVGSWLHGTAYRTALKAKAAARRRRAVERKAEVAAAVEETPELIWRELWHVLDEEIGQLPERYRSPLVLCYLEGKTNAEAAKLLRWPKGTVATRLARAREQLRKRLTQRGAAPALAGLCAATVSASLRASVVQAAVRIAAGMPAATGVVSEQSIALAKGVLQAMWITKMRLIAVVALALATVGAGAGLYIHHSFATADNVAFQADLNAETPSAEPSGVEEEREERIIPLRNVAATDVANAITTYLAEHAPELKDKAIVQPEPPANKLRISAPTGSFGMIRDLVKKLDADVPQISIEIIVVDVDQDGHEDVLSRPQIITLDNHTAQFFVGQTVPIPKGHVIDAEGVEQVAYEDVPVGIALQITPRIQPDGKIVIRLQLTASQAAKTNVGVGNGEFARAINSQSMETTITAEDGQTVTTAAMRHMQTVRKEYKYPVLSELPIVGAFFHFRQTSQESVDMRVSLTPHIASKRDEADRFLSEQAKKIDEEFSDPLHLPIPAAMPR